MARQGRERSETIRSEVRELTIERVGAQGDGVADGRCSCRWRCRASGCGPRSPASAAELVEVLAPSPERVRAAVPALRRLRRLRPAALAQRALSGLEGRADPRWRWRASGSRPRSCRRSPRRRARAGGWRCTRGRRPRAARARASRRGGRGGWSPIEVCPIADPRLVAALAGAAAPGRAAVRAPEVRADPARHADRHRHRRRHHRRRAQAPAALSADARRGSPRRAAAADFARVTLAGEIALPVAACRWCAIGRRQRGAAGGRLPAGGRRRPRRRWRRSSARRWPAPSGSPTSTAASAPSPCAWPSTPPVAAVRRLGAGGRGAERGARGARAGPEGDRRRGARPGAPAGAGRGAEARRRRGDRSAARRRRRAAPRAGQVRASARVAGVSCNPATFARDARILTDAGFTLARVLPVDQFLWSPHVELVGVFERSGG